MEDNTAGGSASHHLNGKCILVTGGAQRLGAHIARTLHGLGANLIVHYRSSRQAALKLQEALNKQRKESVVLVQADLLDASKVPAVIKESAAAWNRLDALVNNASSFYPTPVGEVSEQHWNDLLGSNLKAPFFLAQAAAPFLSKQNGCIVNIVDIHAERPLKDYPVYSIAKAGLAMMTRALACELGPNVRVNGVAPGAILWPEVQMDDITKQRIVSRTFLKRRGEPQNIADAVAFLVSNAVYTTGHILVVDGGRSLNS